MLSQSQTTMLQQKLNELNEEVGAEYDLRRLEAAYCSDFNKNRACTKPDKMAKNLTRQLVVEDGLHDDARIERMLVQLQLE
uniref:Uncharacterized protein n=1 Tax=Plectus sambesii TaxID=2011161 RepID=A0A914XDH1_9BILA